MKDLLDKLSSYNIFNNLLPGILFAVLASKLTRYSFIQPDIIIGVFLYYFIGVVISRFGSLIIEPALKRVKFLCFANYKDYISASKTDDKIEILSEVNNMYRTLCSLLVIILLLKIYQEVASKFPFLEEWGIIILYGLLLVMFLASYRKLTNYITKRIAATK
jgi:uncharacterized membrane protein (DUF441 family)